VFRIGEFSRLARVSCRLLRYYDEIGLLRPARIDDTGYRYYGAEQLSQLNRILVLKELGFSLEEIAKILARELSAGELRAMLLVRKSDLVRALDAEAERLRHVEARIAQIDAEGELSSDDVVLRAEPETRILSVRRTIASFAAARELIAELGAAVHGRLPASALGALMCVAHAEEFELDRIDLEAGFVLVAEPRAPVLLSNGEPLTARSLPAVERMAACVRVGLPEHAHLITARISRFVASNGYRLAGPSREVFLERPRLDRMESAIVEMQFPVEKAV
jgi:DNA-binding transcriptional MerR regulator